MTKKSRHEFKYLEHFSSFLKGFIEANNFFFLKGESPSLILMQHTQFDLHGSSLVHYYLFYSTFDELKYVKTGKTKELT